MDGNAETSLVLAELYRHGGGFKLRAVGRGFHGGLKPLAEAHGVEVEDDAPESGSGAQPHAQGVPGHMEAAATYSGPPKDTVQEEAPRPALNLTKIDLLKQQVGISLRKKNLDQEKARVAVVFDASGSMAQLYAKGVVQRAFERVLAVAAKMDDDGMLDVWFFATKSKRMPSVNEHGYEDYVKRTYPGPKMFGDWASGTMSRW